MCYLVNCYIVVGFARTGNVQLWLIVFTEKETTAHVPIIKFDERNRGYSFGHPKQLFRMRFDVSLPVGFTAAMTVKYIIYNLLFFFL